MTDKFYYLFYDRINGKIIRLDLFNANLSIDEAIFVKSQLTIDGRLTHDDGEVVMAINKHNLLIYKRYVEKFKIKPPYYIENVFGVRGMLNASLIYKGRQLLLKEYMLVDKYNDVAPFFAKYDYTKFNIYYMIELHRYILNNQIIRPDQYNSGWFDVTILDKSYIANVVVSVDREHCFLCIQGRSNGVIFSHHKIGKAKVLEVLGIDKWFGDWPETTEGKVYELINYINECRNSDFNIDKVEISGNEVITDFARLEIKQSKNGKWYISGSLENILKLFHIDNQVELKQMVNNLFGSKRRAGVFPELDSRDDVIKLIKATQHE
jgi:hypothetical protein